MPNTVARVKSGLASMLVERDDKRTLNCSFLLPLGPPDALFLVTSCCILIRSESTESSSESTGIVNVCFGFAEV